MNFKGDFFVGIRKKDNILRVSIPNVYQILKLLSLLEKKIDATGVRNLPTNTAIMKIKIKVIAFFIRLYY